MTRTARGAAAGRGRWLAALVIMAGLGVSSCGDDDGDAEEAEPATSTSARATSTTESQGAAPAVTLPMRARNGSGQDGTASLSTTADGKTRVLLDLANSPPGPQPTHINAGTCEDLGDIVHILGGTRGGKVEATVDATLDSLLAGEFALSVAKSPQDFGVIVSCADIVRT